MDLKKKTSKILIGSFLVYALLVATHLGEFWPFSVYPMYSQGGKPWNRSLVRIVDEGNMSSNKIWKVRGFDNLPGDQVAMTPMGISQNDMANMISKTKVWDEQRVSNLRTLFNKHLDQNTFLIYKVHGEKTGDSERPVAIDFTPYIMISDDTTVFNPNLEFNHLRD